MAKIRLTEENAKETHPDYQLLHEWLTAHGANVMWVRVPQDIEVTPNEVLITEYLHTAEGGLIYDVPGKTVRTRIARYPRKRRPLPKLTSTEIA